MNATRRIASKARFAKRIALATIVTALAAALIGCVPHHDVVIVGSSAAEYAAGYDDGFASDADYHDGYDDSWFTVGSGPILYNGSSIPFLDEVSYSSGFWDGVFDAYNDGYFVAYRYAFVIGFSEGYDNGYWADYLDFLATDFHPEFEHGGFSDGYHDGFSEGRVFGAFDFEAGFPFDWMDALLDWESGTDLFFAEVGVGTGAFGPVTLYEWATDPLTTTALAAERVASSDTTSAKASDTTVSPRSHLTGSGLALSIARPLTSAQKAQLNVIPPVSLRAPRPLLLTSTWLERINLYNSTGSSSALAPSTKRVRARG